MGFKLVDLVDPDTMDKLEESYEKLNESHIPEGFTVHQIEELEERKKEKMHQLYSSPLGLFNQNKEKIYPKNRLGKWISTLLALSNGNGKEAWQKAVCLTMLNTPVYFERHIEPPKEEASFKLQPGKKIKVPAFLKKLSNKKVKDAAKLAAFAGVKIEYDKKIENVKLECLCKFSNHALYPINFLHAAKRDRIANQTYKEVADWYEKLPEEDKQFFLESYIKQDGIPINFTPRELTFEKSADPLPKRLKGLKYWERNGKVIFDGEVWHTPRKEAVSYLGNTIKYDPHKVINERKQTLRNTLRKTFLPLKNIPQRILFYGFFLKAGRKIIPAGIFTSQFNKEMLYENEQVKSIFQKKKEETKAKRTEKQQQFNTYYNRALKALKAKDWTAFWKTVKTTTNNLEKTAYYKAKKDIKDIADEAAKAK